jgi:hypothetical protein
MGERKEAVGKGNPTALGREIQQRWEGKSMPKQALRGVVIKPATAIGNALPKEYYYFVDGLWHPTILFFIPSTEKSNDSSLAILHAARLFLSFPLRVTPRVAPWHPNGVLHVPAVVHQRGQRYFSFFHCCTTVVLGDFNLCETFGMATSSRIAQDVAGDQ